MIGSSAAITRISGAIVSYDAANGTIVSVIPYLTENAVSDPGSGTPIPTKSVTTGDSEEQAEPKPRRSGNILIYRGRFPAAFDGAGRNMAPNGGTEIHIDARTGALLAVR
jgi:hypothetical protein